MSQTVVESASYVPDTYHQEEVPAGVRENSRQEIPLRTQR